MPTVDNASKRPKNISLIRIFVCETINGVGINRRQLSKRKIRTKHQIKVSTKFKTVRNRRCATV